MKLLGPQATRDAQGTELARDILRKQETESALADVNRRMAQSEADFASMIARHQRIWAEEESEHAIRVSEMEDEVRDLEERRRDALVPISIESDKAERLMLEATSALALAHEKSERNEETYASLEEKLDAVGEREISVQHAEERMRIIREGLKAQAEEVGTSSERLSQALQEFASRDAMREELMSQREWQCDARETGISEREKQIDIDRLELVTWESRLRDERGTLDRAFERLNKK